MIPSLVVIGVVVVIGFAIVAYRNRGSDRGIESGISSFRRELQALAPDESDPGTGRDDRVDEDVENGDGNEQDDRDHDDRRSDDGSD